MKLALCVVEKMQGIIIEEIISIVLNISIPAMHLLYKRSINLVLNSLTNL